MQEPTTLEKLRQLAATPINSGIESYPDWFQERHKERAYMAFTDFFTEAADELEQMQKLNGRLLRRLADGEWIEESS